MPLSDPTPKRDVATLQPNEKGEVFTEYRWHKGDRPSIWQIIEEIQAEHREITQALTGRKGSNTVPLANPTAGAVHIEEGRYLLKLTDIQDVEPNSAHPEWGPGIKFVFAVHDQKREQLLDDEDAPVFISPLTGTSTGPKSKARPILEALLGREIEMTDTGAGLAAEALGKWCSALISDNDKGFSTVMKYTAIKPAKKQADEEEAA